MSDDYTWNGPPCEKCGHEKFKDVSDSQTVRCFECEYCLHVFRFDFKTGKSLTAERFSYECNKAEIERWLANVAALKVHVESDSEMNNEAVLGLLATLDKNCSAFMNAAGDTLHVHIGRCDADGRPDPNGQRYRKMLQFKKKS